MASATANQVAVRTRARIEVQRKIGTTIVAESERRGGAEPKQFELLETLCLVLINRHPALRRGSEEAAGKE
jgi:hypothetical protein